MREASIANLALIDKLLETSGKRRETFSRLKAALLAHDTTQALKLARELCGIEEEGHRTDPRLN